MKKLIYVLFLLGMVVPVMSVSAATQPSIPDWCYVRADPQITECNTTLVPMPGPCAYALHDTVPCALCCAVGLITYITNIIFVLVILIVVVLIVFAAYNFITSSGDPAKVATGRSLIIWAMIGLAVALLARGIPYLVRVIMINAV